MENNDYFKWNKMEDEWIRMQEGGTIKDVHDWKGNIIKHGDEICIIKFKDVQIFKNLAMVIPTQNGDYTEVKINTQEKDDEDCWEIGEYYKVFSYRGQSCITGETKDYSFTQFVSTVVCFINPRTHLLAIKGISDKTK